MAGRLIAGVMSGTSADGVDVAIVRIDGVGLAMKVELLGHHHRDYDSGLRQRIFGVREAGAKSDLHTLAQLGREITLTYAAAVHEALLAAKGRAKKVAAIAAHGQTLFHDPPHTVQWLDPALLAWETGCTVVSDFRRADCAAGGQGAPLVPFADYLLFRHASHDRVLLNLGGIANLTYLPAGASLDRLVAFDTGPGNCISDWVCRERSRPTSACDEGGAGALRGTVREDVARRFLAHDYFRACPPKSTDGPAMIDAMKAALGEGTPATDDLLATAARVTAGTVVDSILGQIGNDPGATTPVDLIVSGGGVHNRAIMQGLRARLPARVTIRTTADLGIPADAKEAVAFALLASATLDGEPSNVPSVTGARRRVILGCITPAP
jgi:anhydro-N-acetylmuramic acid kinase